MANYIHWIFSLIMLSFNNVWVFSLHYSGTFSD